MKKKFISTLLTLTMLSGSVFFGGANTVSAAGVAINSSNFPDAEFRSYISTEFDSDSDGSLSAGEIEAAKMISISDYDNQLYSVEGIKYFTSLVDLDIPFSHVTSVDVSGMTNLEMIDIMYCEKCTTINVKGCSALKSILASNSGLTSLDISTNPEIMFLSIENNPQLPMPNLANNKKISNLYVGCNGYSSLDLSGLSQLYKLEAQGNKFTSINVSDSPYICEIFKNPTASDSYCYDGDYNKIEFVKYTGEELASISVNHGTTIITNSSSVEVPGATTTSTPTTTTAPTATPTSAPTTPRPTVGAIPTAAPTTAAKKNVGDFVNRCYSVALGRSADSDGFTYWKDKLVNGQACGAQVGFGFIFSGEYSSKSKSNEDYIKDLYNMFFGRTPDTSGYNYWVEQLKAGVSREEVFAGFANSLEFYNLCEEYGVVSGYYAVGVDNDRQGGVNCFVARLYKTCLNRLPDMGSQAAWVQKLLANEVTGTQIAYSFAFSPEFIQMNLSREGYVAYMYRAFFGREADQAGFEGWVNKMIDGASNEDVFDGFTGSIEFDALCQKYGIKR